MKIKMLRSVLVAGKATKINESVDVSDKEAKFLISRGMAKPVGKSTQEPTQDK